MATEQDLSEAEEEIASALSLPELPTVASQRHAIEERQAALYAGEIAIPADVVDEVLRSGGNRDRSQLRLIYNFMTDPTPEEAAEFVKREYGVGGNRSSLSAHSTSRKNPNLILPRRNRYSLQSSKEAAA